MIAEMKSPSADRTRATADEIKKYEDALANLNAQIEKLSEAKAKVEQEIKNIEGLKDNTQKIIDDATKVRDQVKNGYADATSTEAVETMITQVTAETTSLNSDGAESINAVIADINTQIASIEAEIAAINTDVADISKKTEDLNKEVTAGIGNISIDENDIQGRYDLNGRPVDANYKGAMIIRMTNGKTITIIKR
jgi:chromosome segregation ATPase